MKPTSIFIRNSQGRIVQCFFLRVSINAFYHADYSGGGNWSKKGSIENMIWTLKNDVSPFPDRLPYATSQLQNILIEDLPQILQFTRLTQLVVCVIPRSKSEDFYRNDQKLFRHTIKLTIQNMYGFLDGTDYIIRHTDTKTTHLSHGGQVRLPYTNGDAPYPGITHNTCTISNAVKNKDILLIDDLYTKTVNIDEDAVQALLDHGAKSVFFYSIGKTISKY